MSQAPSQSRGLHPIRAAASVLRMGRSTLMRLDPDGLRYVATILVWAHWFVVAFSLVQLAYRPAGWPERYVVYAPLFLLLVAFNGYTHYRLATNKTITWRWILGLAAMDVTMVSVATAIGGGFSHYFLHLLYYPLLARIFVMYAVAATVNLISSFERSRWRAAVERERALQRERIELSQAIHDTTAQTAFMIGLGIDAAKQVAGDSNEELTARLDATSRLSKTAVWQLRHPIDMGRIFEGSELGWTLDSHVATFRTLTSVSAELTQNGVEPPLSIGAKSQLFTIAHNALANAFRHAGASRVLVELNFGRDELRLSVSDDGVGLPDDYEGRGHGFENMRAYAGRLGGRLIVEPRGSVGGASVTCVMPLYREEQEG